jgi:hypothetical protein
LTLTNVSILITPAVITPGIIGAIVAGICGGLLILTALYCILIAYRNKLNFSQDPAEQSVVGAVAPYGMSAGDPFLPPDIPADISIASEVLPSAPLPPTARAPMLFVPAPVTYPTRPLPAPVTYPTRPLPGPVRDSEPLRSVKWVNL